MSRIDEVTPSAASVLSPGGSVTALVTGVQAAQVIKATAGRLCRIVVTVAGTTATTFYDNTAAAAGTVLFVVPANATVGQVFDVQMPAAAGIVASQAATGPSLTVSYN